MIEPDLFNMGCGKRNFKLNGMHGDFTNAFIGKESREGKTATVCVDDFIAEKKIEYVDILHSDIQGYEYEMLQGALKTITTKKVGFVFVSTHSQEVHLKCRAFLLENDFFIISEADMNNTYSQDGLIVAASPNSDWRKSIPISSKRINS